MLDGRGPSGGRKVDFQEFHDDARLRTRKRLYMTATPRLYTVRSRSKLAEQGVAVVDMGDYEVYGPELHRLPFAKAVDHADALRLPGDRSRGQRGKRDAGLAATARRTRPVADAQAVSDHQRHDARARRFPGGKRE